MSTVLVAGVLVGFIAFATLLFIAIENRKERNRMNQFLTRFSELGTLNNLTFSSQEILKDAAIGLDGVHRKLLLLTGNSETSFSNRLLHLNEVKSCSVIKQYGTIGATDLKKNGLENYLEKIILRFEFKNEQEPVEVNFYHHVTSDVYEIKAMNEKAKHWEVVLSKLLKSPLKEAA